MALMASMDASSTPGPGPACGTTWGGARTPSAARFNDYEGFVAKFRPPARMTTDECYTPGPTYAAALGWLGEQVPLGGREIVRPFFPGGDYEAAAYPPGCVVVDNPPFSIVAAVKRFYLARGVKFFLFAPALTLFSGAGEEAYDVTYILTGSSLTFTNGARVAIGFVSNLFGPLRIWLCPGLGARLAEAQGERPGRAPARYELPPEVVNAARLGGLARRAEFRVDRGECRRVRNLDAGMGSKGKIYGHGFLLSRGKARELAALRAAHAPARVRLSAREEAIVDALGGGAAEGGASRWG